MAQYTVDSFIVELGFSEKVVKGLQRVEKMAMQSAQRIERNINKAFDVKPNKSSQDALNRLVKNAQTASGRINKSLNNAMNLDSQGVKSLRKLETQGKKTAKEINKALKQAMNVEGRVNIRGGVGKGRGNTIPPVGGGSPRVRPDIAQRQMERMFNNNFYSGLTRRLETIGGQGNQMATSFRGSLQGIYNKYKGSGKVGEYEMEVKKLIDTTKRWVIAENARLKAVRESAWLQDRANSSLRQLVGGFVSAYAMLELAQKTIDAGVKRQSAQLASTAIFGGDTQQARMFAATFSHQIGQNYTDTMKQYSNFAAGAQPELGFQGTQEFYKNAAMFSRIRGATDEDLKGIMVAFQQMASKGKIQAEELRGQLGDRLAGAVQLFADAIGKTPQELDKLMKDGKLLAKDVLPKVSERMRELVEAAGGMNAVSKQTATSMGQAKAMWDNTLVALFNNSSEGISQLSNSIAMFLQGSLGTSEALGTGIGYLLKGASNLLDFVTDIMYRISSLYYTAMGYYKEMDAGQQKLVKEASEFLATVVAIGGAVAVVSKAVKLLSGLVGGGIFGKILQKFGVSAAGTAAAGETAAATAGVTAARMALGVGGSALMLTSSVDKNAGKRFNEVNTPNPFNESVSGITNPKRPMFFDQNGQLQFAQYTTDTSGNIQRVDNGLSNWDIIMNNLSESLNNFANKFNQTPMMMTPSGLPLQTKQTLNVSFNLDGKQIATKMVDITDKNQEDILLNSSYPEDE
ncbi:tail length tape-measure protein [Citrobacter phage Michonne]|uniref:Tail length tape-measure protein n=2 Tax=Mooglevirus mordin TaxID=1985305 RepID=A0A0K2CN60_9CAUD|nr:tail length tape measure protein [Citrobacter phage Michonne]YP_009606602.1 tail length tape measure protein [Citrobacter phage Mordin]AKU44018.1 tail length tape-measure protein [Citrobacter phage Michonne]ALA06884.1 tail length tape-measure protein [Citrobacter phage Mordin]AYR00812.1 tape measure protein [Citrobacter phage Maleficent]